MEETEAARGRELVGVLIVCTEDVVDVVEVGVLISDWLEEVLLEIEVEGVNASGLPNESLAPRRVVDDEDGETRSSLTKGLGIRDLN